MTLVDTSVWIDHFVNGNARLDTLLRSSEVVCHPFVLGELALGTMPDRPAVLRALRELGRVEVATDEEVMGTIESLQLHGRGIGWVDSHLLVSALLSGTYLFTLDHKLRGVANELGLLA